MVKFVERRKPDPDICEKLIDITSEADSDVYPWTLVAAVEDDHDQEEVRFALKQLALDGTIRIDHMGRLYTKN